MKPVRFWAWLLPVVFAACGALVPYAGVDQSPRTIAWTAMPFLLFGLFGALHLWRAPRPLVIPRLVGLVSAVAGLLALGWWLHRPGDKVGVNFGVFAFPAYAVLVAPVAYAVGRVTFCGPYLNAD